MRIPNVIPLTLVMLLLCVAAASGANQATGPAPKLVVEDTAHSFEAVVDGTLVTHDFIVRNDGDEVLHINKVKTG